MATMLQAAAHPPHCRAPTPGLGYRDDQAGRTPENVHRQRRESQGPRIHPAQRGARVYQPQPLFVVRYYPLEQPERVWYQAWENDVHLVGRNLLAVYDDLKANTPEVWQESDGPQDAEHPYIETIEFRLRL
jgi:hypothetical protein